MKLIVATIAALVLLAGSALAQSQCKSYLVETIPQDLVYNETIISKDTTDQLLELINAAQSSIDIASFYWTLQGNDVMPRPVPESKKGEQVLSALATAAKSRSVKVRIAVNDDKDSAHSADLSLLGALAQIQRVNFTRLVGAGILHTKFVLVDNQSFYLGSANMDWRSLTHVKEMGLTASNCPALAQDLANIFSVYWYLGGSEVELPSHWPAQYSVAYNLSSPHLSSINGQPYSIYLSSSPAELCPDGRSTDIDSILHTINTASHFIYIAVMDYFPLFLYKRPTTYWAVIDEALRRAAIERGVNVRLLASHWNHTRSSMRLFLKSLSALDNQHILKGSVEARFFTVPILSPAEQEIPFARVNHNKYMVTDKVAYIGTSNWSADYFVSTGGVGIALSTSARDQTNLRDQLKSVFERDWNSEHSQVA